MIDDYALADRLRKLIKVELEGDGTKEGHYRSALAAANMEELARIKGIVFAYNRTLEMVDSVIREMNEPPSRSMLMGGGRR